MSKSKPHAIDERAAELVRLLSSDAFRGGDELGEQLGIGRAAVWKQIQKLQEWGLDIQSVRGKGYRLAYPLEWLEETHILERLNDKARGLISALDVRSVVPSTNDIAMAQANQGCGSGYVCLAEQQTAGRGRRGRQWVSPFASNLYVSVVWEFFQGAAQLEGLSLATGVAVANALARLGVSDVRLKWPNDVLVSGAKLSGVLLEMTGDPTGRCQVVLGVGVNHRLPKGAAEAIDQAWVRLEDVKPGIGRNELAAAVLSELVVMLRQFSLTGFHAFQEQWQALDGFAGRAVVIKTGAADVSGIARGVDRTGGLQLETAEGVQVMKGGELSLRLAES